MGLFKSIAKAVKKVVKKVASVPFETFRDAWRSVESLGQGVGQLAQGNVEGAFKSAVGSVGHATKGALNAVTAGGVSDNGYLVDTKVKQDVDKATSNLSEKASVSFAEAGSPSVVVGADEIEEDILKRNKNTQAGFLGGISTSGGSLLL